MVITIFGATGTIGKELIRHCQAKDYEVRAYGRNVENLIDEDLRDEHFEAIKGSVFDEKDIYKAINGADAVLTALGGGSDGVDKTRSLGMKNIVGQMKKAGVNRLIGIGGIGILPSDPDTLLMDTPGFPQQYVVVSHEHFKAYEYLLASGLDWTFVCPPSVNSQPANGRFSTGAEIIPAGNTISAGNLALFMVMEITNRQFVHQRVGIADL